MSAFTAPHFNDETAAREYLERLTWPDGPICAHCGSVNDAYKTNRPGVYRCAAVECRKDFTAQQRTVMARSHIKLHLWFVAFHLMTSSKKGVSAHQLHRTLGITYRSAWFMAHRIREAMRDGGLVAPEPGALGGEGKVVEADETYFGKIADPKPSPQRKGRPYLKSGGGFDKRPILSLVERGGQVRSFHIPVATKATVMDIVTANIAKESRLMTDESRLYGSATAHFADHQTTKHSAGEYVRLTDREVHSNTVENYFSIFKRGMKGIYQHCAEKHLHRYLAEFDFRYSHRVGLGYNDPERMIAALKGAEGKRLTYKEAH